MGSSNFIPKKSERSDAHITALRNAANTLASNFAQAEPFRRVVIDDFLDPTFCRDIVHMGPAYKSFDAKGFDALIRHPASLQLTGWIAGIEICATILITGAVAGTKSRRSDRE
jgi:hypothetical protein